MSEPLELGDETPTALYRFYAADGTLLYVGITNNLKGQFAGHAADKKWWPEVARKTVEWHLSRDVALAAELVAIRAEHPKHNIAGVEKPDRPRRLTRTDERPRLLFDPDLDRCGDRAPDDWPPDYWCLVWWTSEQASNTSQYEMMEIFTCPRRDAITAMGLWYEERRADRERGHGHPLAWHQEHPDPRDDRAWRSTWSIHADVTCLDSWGEFTPEVAQVQSEFLSALLDAGYCTVANPGSAAAAFGFTFERELEARIAGTILCELMWGRTDVAIKSTEALRREASERAA